MFLKKIQKLLILDVKHAVTVTLKIGIRDLLPEFLTDALVFLRPFQAAGAITSGPLQTVFDHLNHFLVIVEPYSHLLSSFPWSHIIGIGLAQENNAVHQPADAK